MLRQIVVVLLLVLHVNALLSVPHADGAPSFALTEKIVDTPITTVESDYCSYSSYISLNDLEKSLGRASDGMGDEEIYPYSCFNILSPPPEHTIL